MGVVSFLSDFGLDDAFVGVCHGVVLRIAPHVRIVDVSHCVEPGDVRQGALLLARATPYFPVAVHLAVVDPGVGTARRGVAIGTVRGDVLVGPDNGLLTPAARTLGGMTGAWELTNPEHRLAPVSRTFHGRDVFAPAAGAVASGVEPAELGDAVTGLVDLEPMAPPVVTRELLEAEVVYVDRFGNLQLSADREDLEVLGLDLDQDLLVSVAARRSRATYVRTFGELADGALGLYEDSDWQLALAVKGGSAARMFEAGRGAIVRVYPESKSKTQRRE
ncbi:MAG: SAM-dependent chlorinase/fluorinase [Actinomycetota bacterium]|nr:SAM-dependent chlorinase/fluorinase [Actinomycetota bacterium]